MNQAPIKFELSAFCRDARAGTLETPHGQVETPCFMPVGTHAAVKAMAPDELWEIGYRMVLANAYHLAVRPGSELIRAMGGAQKFMGWRGAMLTDSGGFQALSLAGINSIDERGISFRSHLDGRRIVLTPESAIEIQQNLGSDIMMALDECTPFPAEPERVKRSLELTTRWADRSLTARKCAPPPALFGIVQGGMYPELRRLSAAQITSMAFDGFATGGLSVGEPRSATYEMAALSVSMLPRDKPRYLMGVGTPEDLIFAVKMGYDLFDCVLPTRNARNGGAFTSRGRVSIKQSRHSRAEAPLDPDCECRCCKTFSRAYLRHLHVAGEILAARALTEHNLYFYRSLMRAARAAIATGCYEEYSRAFMERLESAEDSDEAET